MSTYLLLKRKERLGKLEENSGGGGKVLGYGGDRLLYRVDTESGLRITRHQRHRFVLSQVRLVYYSKTVSVRNKETEGRRKLTDTLLKIIVINNIN